MFHLFDKNVVGVLQIWWVLSLEPLENKPWLTRLIVGDLVHYRVGINCDVTIIVAESDFLKIELKDAIEK